MNVDDKENAPVSNFSTDHVNEFDNLNIKEKSQTLEHDTSNNTNSVQSQTLEHDTSKDSNYISSDNSTKDYKYTTPDDSESFGIRKVPLRSLVDHKHYFGHSDFKNKFHNLTCLFSELRPMPRDNLDCRDSFYQSIIVGLCEYCHYNVDEKFRIIGMFKTSFCQLIESGHSRDYISEFYEALKDLIKHTPTQYKSHQPKECCNVDIDDYLDMIISDQTLLKYGVVFLRLSLSNHMRRNKKHFKKYVEPYTDVDSFCSSMVEPMESGASEVHVKAMSEMLKISLKYYEITKDTMFPFEFPSINTSTKKQITFLRHKFHYDLIYPCSSVPTMSQ